MPFELVTVFGNKYSFLPNIDMLCMPALFSAEAMQVKRRAFTSSSACIMGRDLGDTTYMTISVWPGLTESLRLIITLLLISDIVGKDKATPRVVSQAFQYAYNLKRTDSPDCWREHRE